MTNVQFNDAGKKKIAKIWPITTPFHNNHLILANMVPIIIQPSKLG